MNKFKFGDMVRHKITGSVFVVSGLDEDDGYIAAMDEASGIVWSVEVAQLELIPHPDTVILDYMGKLVAGSLGLKSVNGFIKQTRKGKKNDS